MRRKMMQIAVILLCLSLCIPTGMAARRKTFWVRVGLAYGDGALTAANLQNNDGYGEGFRFGYFDEDLEFEELAWTDDDVTEITMLRTSGIYFNGASYSMTEPRDDYDFIGCYHVVVDNFRDYEDALEKAEEYDDAFVAWVDEEFQVRVGAYETKDEAEEMAEELGTDWVEGTSSYAVNVVETGSSRILFQFDGGDEYALGVMPDVTDEDDVRTWFKGYKYRGGFRYERISGGDMTVVNIVDMETYIQGVIPYEMNNEWPMEALKAQAVCARSYAYNNVMDHKHESHHFDLCNTEDCQVYRGTGSDAARYQANERTDEAVEETAGEYALYDGEPIVAYYSSSHGGASESINNVWGSSLAKYPYICGVIDPYERLVADINPKSYWSVSYTTKELTDRLQDQGFAKGTKVDELELTYSALGNVIKVTVNYTNGKSNTFTPQMSWGVRSLFGVSSLHYTVNGEGPEDGKEISFSNGVITVNETEQLDTEERVYVTNSRGKATRVDVEDLYIITGDGSVDPLEIGEGGVMSDTPVSTVVTVSDDVYVVEGAGNGHQLGMSQYGAYAMAEEGFDYDEIIEFYYPGVEVDTL